MPRGSRVDRKTRAKAEPAARPHGWRWRGALAALALLAYANSFGLGLARDGKALVAADPRVRAATLDNLRLILENDYWWPSSVDRLYRPLTTGSFLLNYAVLGNGTNPAGYHVLNWLLHAGNVWLVFELALLVLGNPAPAAFAAALWAVHPLGTEAVANVAGRADLLAAMAVLAGLLLYIRAVSAHGRRLALAACALFGIALAGFLSKESAVVLAGLIVLWDISFSGSTGPSLKRRLPLYGAVAAALLVMLAARQRVLSATPWPEMPFVDNPLRAAPFWIARLTAVQILARYLGLLVFPFPLSSDRAYNEIPLARFTDVSAWLALLLIVALGALAAARYRKDRVIFWAAGFFAIALLPTSNLVLLIGSNMADRFLYLPSAGFAIAAVALAYRLPGKRTAAVLLAVVLTFFTGRTLARNPDWDSDLALATADVQSAPGSFRPHDNLAAALNAQAPLENLDRVIQESERAWDILHNLPPADIYQQTPANLGLYYRAKGDVAGGPNTAAGRTWYEKSLAVLLRAREASQAHEKAYDEGQRAHGLPLATRVAYQPLYFYLGATYAGLQKYGEALEAYRYARVLNPAVPASYDGIAEVEIAAGNPVGAAVALDEKILALGPGPQSLGALEKVYAQIPGGACALAREGNAARLNLGCPVLHDHVCRAWGELADVFVQARLPRAAGSFRAQASRQGCTP